MSSAPKQSSSRPAAQPKKGTRKAPKGFAGGGKAVEAPQGSGKAVAVAQIIETAGKVIAKRVTHVVLTDATVGSKRRPQISAEKMRRLVAKHPPAQEWFDEDFSHPSPASTMSLVADLTAIPPPHARRRI